MKPMAAILLFSILLVACASPGTSHKKGDTARVTVGTVKAVETVTLDSNVGKGALIGGALGWALARNQSTGRQVGAAAAGAMVGGAATDAAQGDRKAMRYTVQTGEGTSVKIVTDQTQIRIGDCVVVEETKKSANIRRAAPSMCQPGAKQAVAAVQAKLQEEARECDEAKQELLAATTTEQLDLAERKMKILCNH